MLHILILFFSLTPIVYAQTAERPLKVVAEAGHNVTLSHLLPGFNKTGHVTWLIEIPDYGSAPSNKFVFSGQKLCEFANKNLTWSFPQLIFKCDNYDITLFWLKIENSAIYNVKNTIEATESNIYYQLTVIQINPPNCIITSKYLTEDYCHITINCTNSRYPNKVIFNNVTRSYYGYAKGSSTLPNYFTTNFNVSGITKTFKHTYPFSELCTYPSSENFYNSKETVSTIVFIVIIGFSVLIILGALIYLCWHRRFLYRSKSEPCVQLNAY